MADVMLEHQMDLALHTAGELAKKAGVSTATAARLIRTLDYSSYPAAKRQIREATHWGSPQGGAIDNADNAAEAPSLEAVVHTNIDNIRTTADGIPPQTLEDIYEARGASCADQSVSNTTRNLKAGRFNSEVRHTRLHHQSGGRPEVQVVEAASGDSLQSHPRRVPGEMGPTG